MTAGFPKAELFPATTGLLSTGRSEVFKLLGTMIFWSWLYGDFGVTMGISGLLNVDVVLTTAGVVMGDALEFETTVGISGLLEMVVVLTTADVVIGDAL